MSGTTTTWSGLMWLQQQKTPAISLQQQRFKHHPSGLTDNQSGTWGVVTLYPV
jgi:hypothetical protein